MATIKSIARFIPTPPPQNVPIELQEWLREEFDRLSSASNGSLDEIEAQIGYGGIDNILTVVPLNDIDTTPQVIIAAQGAVTTPIDVTQDVLNDALVIERPGIWNFEGGVNLTFDEMNNGRTYLTQIYNLTDDELIVEADTFVGRNTGGSNWSIAFLLTVREININKQLQLRIVGNGVDTFENVDQRRMVLHVTRVDKDRSVP